MKQNITEDQFNELDNRQKDKWYAFCRKNKYVLYDHGGNDFEIAKFPSIGEMIGSVDIYLDCIIRVIDGYDVYFNIEDKSVKKIHKKELCDALWEAVKEELKV